MSSLWVDTDTQVCNVVVDKCAHMRCATIDLSCSQVVLKINNNIFNINSIIKLIDVIMIITYFDPKFKK